MLLTDLYRQLSVDDKKVRKQLLDSGKAIFIKHLPTPVDSTFNQRSAKAHETNDKADDHPNDQESSTPEVNTLHVDSQEKTSDKVEVHQAKQQLSATSDTSVTQERKESHGMEQVLNKQVHG